jgi:hypothetical protein
MKIKNKVKFTATQWKQLKTALQMTRLSVEGTLEPVCLALLETGAKSPVIVESLRLSAERSLTSTTVDVAEAFGVDLLKRMRGIRNVGPSRRAGVDLRERVAKLVGKEAKRVAAKLVDRLTVTNPDEVPPVRERRGLAAVAGA